MISHWHADITSDCCFWFETWQWFFRFYISCWEPSLGFNLFLSCPCWNCFYVTHYSTLGLSGLVCMWCVLFKCRLFMKVIFCLSDRLPSLWWLVILQTALTLPLTTNHHYSSTPPDTQKEKERERECIHIYPLNYGLLSFVVEFYERWQSLSRGWLALPSILYSTSQQFVLIYACALVQTQISMWSAAWQTEVMLWHLKPLIP